MGRRNKKYKKDLKSQIHERLKSMLNAGIGTSKKQAIDDGSYKHKIFSYSTYHSYWKHCKYFASYIKAHHPDCTTLSSAKKYVNEWLRYRVNHGGINGQPLSAWTITLEREALCKLFGITPDDPNYFYAPKRRREDIKRSRVDVARDKHFSEANNFEFVQFCRGTGCRRNIMDKLEGRDLYTREDLISKISLLENKSEITDEEQKELKVIKDAVTSFPNQEYYIHHRKDKGGRDRYAPIIGEHTDDIVERMRNTKPNAKVWLHVPKNADIHGYRGDYATTIYKLYARPIEDIPYDRINKGSGNRYQSDVYHCRKDEVGKKLDKQAMLKCSKSLGHNRVEVVANNYIRGL